MRGRRVGFGVPGAVKLIVSCNSFQYQLRCVFRQKKIEKLNKQMNLPYYMFLIIVFPCRLGAKAVRKACWKCCGARSSIEQWSTATVLDVFLCIHTHTHIYIYIYIYSIDVLHCSATSWPSELAAKNCSFKSYRCTVATVWTDPVGSSPLLKLSSSGLDQA